MFGFILGTACLIGLISTVRRARRWGMAGHHGCGGYSGYEGHGPWGGGHGPWGGGHGPWGGGPSGRRSGWERGGDAPFFLRWILQELDTTPGQEKVVAEAVRELRETAQKHRGEVGKSRADLAKALRSPGFDEVLLGEAFGRHDAALEAMRKTVVGSLAKIHDALDERQRARLADLVESGPGMFGGFGRGRHGRGPWQGSAWA